MKKISIIIFLAFFATSFINAQCTCGTVPNWFSTELKIGTGAFNKYKCGYQFTMRCSDTVRFRNGGYTCTGTTCAVRYKANVYNSAGRVIRTIDPFNFATAFLVFSRPGTYKLELFAFCNGNSCRPCYYYYTVKNVGCSP